MYEKISLPESFKEGQIIEEIILLSDVDGVIREGVDRAADPRIIEKVKNFLQYRGVDVTFISGTAIENNPDAREEWRKANAPLGEVFGNAFDQEVAQGRVSIFGELGAHRLNKNRSIDLLEIYSPEISMELGKLLIQAFLHEVLRAGNLQQKGIASQLFIQLDSLAIHSSFKEIVLQIRTHIDPHFRLIQNRGLIESSTSNPPWDIHFSVKWLEEEMRKPHYLVSQLEDHQRRIGGGFAKKGENEGFNFLLISKTDKGLATKKHIEERLKKFPRALIVTIGDTQVDFPMHHNGHIAFHVGLEKVHKSHALPHCILIPDANGKDCSHVEGTLQILDLLTEGIGKSFFELKYIPVIDPEGQRNFYSINDLRIPTPSLGDSNDPFFYKK